MANLTSSDSSSSDESSSGSGRTSSPAGSTSRWTEAELPGPSARDPMSAVADEEVEVVMVDDEPGDFAESRPVQLPSSYRLGRSQVTEEALNGYMVEGLIILEVREACRAPG